MIKVILRLDCGNGTDSADAYLVDPEDYAKHSNHKTELKDDTLADIIWSYALQHAESYGIYPESDKPDEFDEDEDFGGDEYSEDINGWLELYDPEIHDGLKAGGGEWVWDTVL